MMSPVDKVGFRMIWRTQVGTTIMTNLRRERGAKFMTVKIIQADTYMEHFRREMISSKTMPQ